MGLECRCREGLMLLGRARMMMWREFGAVYGAGIATVRGFGLVETAETQM